MRPKSSVQQAKLLLDADFNASNVGNVDIEDKPRPARLAKLNNEDLTSVLNDKPSSSAREPNST
ncbi:hypothetical protein KIN20_005977 [Parelaphostrongylus tenuis]|uniref:Uncharacterized protein n=1 Tax=Parelaphostrongylus tenuis TaxID=148309 RepID=A0AAD5M163_PARTN|nr:hypothetical protein KIN20_005977 [Parelaphostrongylus tenuis]